MAGTGTLWAGGVVAESSVGGGQMGAVASRGPEERMTLFRGSGGGGGDAGSGSGHSLHHPWSRSSRGGTTLPEG